MIKQLKKTYDKDENGFIYASVDTLAINEKAVLLEYYHYISGIRQTLTIPLKYYTKRFLLNSVESFECTRDINKIANNLDNLLTFKW